MRTPFASYEVVEETDVVYRVRAKWTPTHIYSKSKCQTEVINQADTIEELCDEFVIKAYCSNEPFLFMKEQMDIKCFIKKCEKDTTIYGAIWTDKGLIYVAKMNDKGELELL